MKKQTKISLCSCRRCLTAAIVFVAVNVLLSYNLLFDTDITINSLVWPVMKDSTQVQTHSRVIVPSDQRLKFSSLPSFSDDDSEIVLGAVLERTSHSAEILYVSTFFLSHYMLGPDVAKKVSPAFVKGKEGGRLNRTLLNSKSIRYKENGQRADNPAFYCRVRWSYSYNETYLAKGYFVPNRQSFDVNANRRVDILRCDVSPYFDIHKDFFDKLPAAGSIIVEILREGTLMKKVISYILPVESRKTGFLLGSGQNFSKYNAWKSSTTEFHLCTPGLRKVPTADSLAALFEFIQHHILIGVTHIFLGVSFPLESEEVNSYRQFLHSFIDDGFVTIVPERWLDDSGIYTKGPSTGFLGLMYQRGDMKTLFNNMCLYISRGSAHYVGFWDVDELFLPAHPGYNIYSVILHAEKNGNMERGLQGKHPLCHLSVASNVFDPLYGPVGTDRSGPPWLGQRFSGEYIEARPSTSRVIANTDQIFYVGAITAGACRLDLSYTSCSEQNRSKARITDLCVTMTSSSGASKPFHNFDERLVPDDAVLIDQGSLYHYTTHAAARNAKLDLLKNVPNQYSSKFFPQVLEALKERNLEAIIDLYSLSTPLSSNRLPLKSKVRSDPPQKQETWVDFSKLYDSDYFLNARLAPLKSFFKDNPISNSANRQASLVAQQDRDVFELPEFARDFSELFLSAVIERHFDIPKLSLSVFLLNHAYLLTPVVRKNGSPLGILSIDQRMKSLWNRALKSFSNRKVIYSNTGERIFLKEHTNKSFSCHISFPGYNNDGNVLIPGTFVPNKLTIDPNANAKLDVLRCSMPYIQYPMLKEMIEAPESLLHVKIYRGTQELIKFNIPWRDRRAGYMLSAPGVASQFYAWKGVASLYDNTLSAKSQATNTVKSMSEHSSLSSYGSIDSVYMCVPGINISIYNVANALILFSLLVTT